MSEPTLAELYRRDGVPRDCQPCAAERIAPPIPTDRWWAQRWVDKATPGELQAMREILFADDLK